jgi:hypothetical protein
VYIRSALEFGQSHRTEQTKNKQQGSHLFSSLLHQLFFCSAIIANQKTVHITLYQLLLNRNSNTHKKVIMCGPEFTNKPRGGALAALSSPTDADRLRSICADLAFHTPGHPESNSATHARLTPDAEYDSSILSDLHIVIQCVIAEIP